MAWVPTVELPILLMFFSMSLSSTVNTNLMLYRTCYVIYGHDKDQCKLLGFVDNATTKALESEVQHTNLMISLTSQLTESVLAVLVSILIGPWSDKFGRRPVFLLTTTAALLNGVFATIFSYFEEMNPWYSLIGGIPNTLVGGVYSFSSVANSYVSERSNDENRGIRLAIFAMAFTLGQVMGSLGSSFILGWTSYTGVSMLTAVLGAISLSYTIFFIPESLKDVQKKGIISGFFDTNNVKEMYHTITKRRENHNRAIILLFTLVGAFSTFIVAGEMPLIFLFVRRKFGWSIQHYTIYNGVQYTIGICGTIAGVYMFQKVLHMRESVASLICFSLMLTGSLINGFAAVGWLLYVSPIIRVFDSSVGPMSVTVVSKIVESDELGKVLAGMMGARFLCTLVSSPLYTAIYNATLDTNPSIYNFVSSFMFAMAIGLLIITIRFENKRRNLPSIDESGNKEYLATD